ncbi:MAG: hypothetical protein ACREE0_09000 [Phenylobacterium sp.]
MPDHDPIGPTLGSEVAQALWLVFTRTTSADFPRAREDLVEAVDDPFGALRDGVLKPRINHSYAPVDGATAHSDVKSRQTNGLTVLIV